MPRFTSITNRSYNKQEFIDLINEMFPDDEYTIHDRIVVITEGHDSENKVTVQNVLFSKNLKI